MKRVQVIFIVSALIINLSACDNNKTIVRQDEINLLVANDYGIFSPSNEGKKYVNYKDNNISYLLESTPVLSFAHATLLELKNANYGKELKINFDKEGATILEKVSSEHKGEKLAIVLNRKVIAIPIVLNTISKGSVVITGLSEKEIKAIFKELKKKGKPENN